MGRCKFLLLGPPHLRDGDQATPLSLRKAVALLAYLSVERRGFSREYLATLLWPEIGTRAALGNLRRTFSTVRRSLGACIVSDGNELRIDRSSVETDAEEFLALRTLGMERGGTTAFEQAMDLYRGSFLEGFNLGTCLEFDDWQDLVRVRLHAELDSLNESAHRLLMDSYARDGRTELAHRQFLECVHVLEREGLEPAPQTIDLHRAVVSHEMRAEPTGPATAQPSFSRGHAWTMRSRIGRLPGLRRSLVITIAAAAMAFVAGGVFLFGLRRVVFGSDVSVLAPDVVTRAGYFSRVYVVVQNDFVAARRIDLDLVFTSDDSIGRVHDYTVHAQTLTRMHRGRTTLEFDDVHLESMIHASAARIPPGTYRVSAVVDPLNTLLERIEYNNRSSSNEWFSYHGSGAPVFEVELDYAADLAVSETNPLRVFFGDQTQSAGSDDWGFFTVTRPGRFFFSEDEVPRRDNDDSGYFLIVIYDSGANVDPPFLDDPGDIAGLCRGPARGFLFGPFRPSFGGPVHPNKPITVTFAPPPLPAEDVYEDDDEPYNGTVIEVSASPVHQFHSFHFDGQREDRDWFRIPLDPGDGFVFETMPAGGSWAADIGASLNDENLEYIGSAQTRYPGDPYPTLTYVNTTAVPTTVYLAVDPYHRDMPMDRKVGEYQVVFREP